MLAVDGPLHRGTIRVEPIDGDLLRIRVPTYQVDVWWDARAVRDAAGDIEELVVNGGRLRNLLFQRPPLRLTPAAARLSANCDVGYLTARPWWGQGLMTEVLTEVVDWAMGQPSVFRIGAFCDVDNVASARVMEKSGLVREGLLRRWLMHPNISDEPRDCFSYARVR
jgi:hypothetical protein